MAFFPPEERPDGPGEIQILRESSHNTYKPMNISASIHGLEEVLADEGLMSARRSHRDPSSPSFIFFDDDNEVDPELKAFREDLLAFEEWNATRDWDDDSTVRVGMFNVVRSVRSWDAPDGRSEAYQERQDSRSRANWTIGFHKRMMHSPSNDRFHRVIRALGLAMTDEDMELAVNPVLEVRKVLQKLVKFAPGPIGGTTFVNPDGSRHNTPGVNPIAAKAAFTKRHNLEEEFVSVDRVQYEGQRESRYVIGQRRTSDTTISHYFDPEPKWKDEEGGTYAPHACALFMVGASAVMPTGSHRLTVREFEQALIAGAQCYDDADEALAGSIEADFMAEGAGYFEEDASDAMDIERLYDGRVSIMETGMGSQGRAQSSFTEEEDYLMGILRMVGAEREVEMMGLASQEPNMIHRSIMANGSYDGVVSLLQFVAKDNIDMLPFVTKALCGDEDAEETKEPELIGLPPFMDDEADSWSIPTGPNGACRRGSFMTWK